MIKTVVKYIGWFGMAAVFAGLTPSCTENRELTEWTGNDPGIPLRAVLPKEAPDNGLLTKMYVFKGLPSTTYRLSDSLEIPGNSARIKMSLNDLDKNNYRFLFVSTPKARPEIRVGRIDGSPLLADTEWEKVAVDMAADSLSTDNYYGIKDMTGKEILQQETIEGELTRLVGQMVFCFYKGDAAGVTNPKVASVLDRVSFIEISYKEIPRQITFDAGLNPVSLAGTEDVLNHTVGFSLSEYGQKVALPQTGVPVEVSDTIPGGAILKGTGLLPCKDKVEVSMTFHYYDTTPVCGHTETGHTHTVECYTPRTLSLNLPKKTGMTGLSVLPDHFTVNNAILPCDRVIDVLHTSGITVNTTWN